MYYNYSNHYSAVVPQVKDDHGRMDKGGFPPAAPGVLLLCGAALGAALKKRKKK